MKIHKKFFSNFRSVFFLFFSFWIAVSASLGSFLFILNFPVFATVVDPVPLAIFTGETNGKLSSTGLVSGDINNDGYDDIIIGSSRYNSSQGRVYIFYGSASGISSKGIGNADAILTGEAVGDMFGAQSSVATGDINNDGYDDLIIGGQFYNGVQGRTYIFYGSHNGIVSKGAGEADVIFTGETTADNRFGCSVSSSTDLNNDGYDDIVIGAYYYNNKQGRAYIFYGGDNLSSVSAANADDILTGDVGTYQFGYNYSAGDINGDNFDDIIIRESNSSPSRVYLFYGSDTGIESGFANSADAILTGEIAGDYFGKSGSFAGDVNNDQYDDVIIGAPATFITGASGKAYIFYGSASGISSKGAESADVIINGEVVSDRFGSSASLIGDVNNDGYDDALVGATGNYSGGNNAGRAYIFFGSASGISSKRADSADVIVTNYSINESFGISLASAKDIENDGWKEFLIGASYYSSSTGKVNLYNLNNNPSLLVNDTTYTNNSDVTITGTASFVGVNIQGVQISVDSGDWISCSASDGVFDSVSESYDCTLFGLAEGSHSVRVRSYDVNNVYIPSTLYATDDFIVDTTSPTGTISINSDEEITNTDEVTLTLSATDNLSEVSKMMVSNKGDYSGGTWETYNTSKEWRLSMGDGEKRVYVKYRDEVGNISSSYSDSIEMDMGAPTGTLVINEGEEYTSSREVVLHITGEDEVTGVEEMRISEDRTMEGVEWEGYETSREYTLSEGDGYKVIYIQYRDGMGNESEVYGSNITLDSQTEIDITEIGEEEVEGEIENWETEETTPTFTGEGEVGATITIEIEGIETGTVIVNEDGVWSWTPSIELTKGQEYNVTITSRDLAGNEDIQTFILGISDEEVINVDQTTPEAQTTTTQLPNTGMILIISLIFLGGIIWTGMNFKVIENLKKVRR